MTWPSTISAFTNPNSTDRLNAPSHSAIEAAQNQNLTAIETFLGTDGAGSTLGTIIYDVRSPGSGGGGHVQTAVLGGTGQTSFTKGDILVATSSSTLSKLAAGLDTQILQVNSSTAAGINWATAPTNRIATSGVISSITGLTALQETSIISIPIPASVLGTNNAIRARVFVNDFIYPTSSVILRANYGSNTISSIILPVNGYAGGAGIERRGTMEIDIINTTPSTQTATFGINVSNPYTPTPSMISRWSPGTASVSSSSANNLGLTIQYSSFVSGDNSALVINGYVIEKIS